MTRSIIAFGLLVGLVGCRDWDRLGAVPADLSAGDAGVISPPDAGAARCDPASFDGGAVPTPQIVSWSAVTTAQNNAKAKSETLRFAKIDGARYALALDSGTDPDSSGMSKLLRYALPPAGAKPDVLVLPFRTTSFAVIPSAGGPDDRIALGSDPFSLGASGSPLHGKLTITTWADLSSMAPPSEGESVGACFGGLGLNRVRAMAAADLDSDGIADLVVGINHSDGSSPFASGSVLSFKGPVDATCGSSPTRIDGLPAEQTEILVTDLDGDCRSDLVVAFKYFVGHTAQNPLSSVVLLQNRTSPGAGAKILFSTPQHVSDLPIVAIEVVDVDRDGHLDLVAATAAGFSPPPELVYYLQQSGRTEPDIGPLSARRGLTGLYTQLFAADGDRDGATDLFAFAAAGPAMTDLVLLHHTSDGSFARAAMTPLKGDSIPAALARQGTNAFEFLYVNEAKDALYSVNAKNN